MSFLSDIWDGVSGFVKDNKDIIKPIVSTGLGALQQSNKDDAQSQYLQYLREREQQNYNDSVAQINAYNAQLGSSGGGGGRSGGGSSAAARQNEKKRLKAAKKANNVSQNTYKEILKMYEPYRKTADILLPQMSQTYQNSLGMQNALAQYVNSPAQVAKLDASVPAYNINVPIPDEVRLK